MTTRRRRRLLELAKTACVLAWLALVGAWVLSDRGRIQPRDEILAYSFILPILIAAFFYGRLGALLTALGASLITGALILSQPDPLQSPEGQRLLFQIVFFNSVALLTSSLAERERKAQASYQALFNRVPVALYRTTPAGLIVGANETLAQLLGFASRQALLDAHLSAVDLYSDPEARRQLTERLEREGVVRGFTMHLQRPDGKRLLILNNARLIRDRSGQAAFYDGSLEDVTERQRAEDAEREQRTQAEALRDTAAALNSTLNFDDVLERILANVNRVVPGDSANIMLCEGNLARIVRSHGYVERSDNVDDAALRLDMNVVTNLHRMAETRQPMVIADTQHYSGWMKIPGSLWIRSYVGAPICTQQLVIGFINLQSAEPDFFTLEHATRLQAFADQAAVALEHARLLAEAERRTEQLKLLYEAGLALNSVLEPRALLEFLFQSAMKLLRADRAEFFRYDPAQKELELELALGYPEAAQSALERIRFSAERDDTVNGWVARHRQTLYLPDVGVDPRYKQVDPEIRSAMWVPVEHEHNLRGLLGVMSVRPAGFAPQDEQLLTLFANQAAVALENAHLFGELRQRLNELEAVNRISVALRLAQTIDEMLSCLLDQTLNLMQIGDGAIWLYAPTELQLHPTVSRGWLAQSAAALAALGETIALSVYHTGQAYRTPDLAQDSRLPPEHRLQLPSGWGGLGVPIRTAQEITGVFFVAVQRPREFSAGEARLLEILAELAGNAIHRATLHAQTEQRLNRVAALREIDAAISGSLDLRLTFNVLLDQVTTQLGVDAAEVLLLNPATQVLQPAAERGFRSGVPASIRLRLGEGLPGRCALERRLISTSNRAEIAHDSGRGPSFSAETFQTYYAAPLLSKSQIKGVVEIFHREPLHPDAEWLNFLEIMAGQAAIAIDNTTLFDDLQRSNTELILAYDATLEGWSHALDLRDEDTQGHTVRVTEIAVNLARQVGIPPAELVHIRRGALLHDIGKMGVPDSILLKPGPLTAEERAVMCRHPDYAYDMIAPIAFLRPALDIPYCHHEKWDGTGYPRGLKGDHIPMAARIFAVVDVWDALSSDRPYRVAWPRDKVRAFLREQAGQHFDPQVIETFLLMNV